MTQYWRPGTDREAVESIPVNSRHGRLPIAQQRSLLPIHAYKQEILYTLETHQLLIIIGETGTGKSTQIPQYLHEAGWTQLHSHVPSQSNPQILNYSTKSSHKAIVCTQPRRVAAVNVSTRVAEELGCRIGEEVGYNVRFHTRISAKTVIKYCSDGVLLRESMSDPLLSRYSVVMIDEAHERSQYSDILLSILKKIMKKRLDLRVIITSATINAESVISYFTDNQKSNPLSPKIHVLSIQGRLHPVRINYLSTPINNYIRGSVETVLAIHKSQRIITGDVLVFLPGSEDIEKATAMLTEHSESLGCQHELVILQLHSSLPTSMQMSVFEATPVNKRKVIFATSMAETSVTIEGIAFVVDSGFSKLNYFNVESSVEYVVTCPVSQASAIQRAGRAGRTSSGVCYRLYTESTYESLNPVTPSEMQRAEISSTILQLKALGISNVLTFDYITPPTSSQVIYSLELLYSLGAIDDKGDLTALGDKLCELSIDIRLGKCLLSSYELGCSEEMLSIAAMCSVEYPFIPLHRTAKEDAKKKYNDSFSEFVVLDGDHLTLLNIYRQYEENSRLSMGGKAWCDSRYLQHKILTRAKEIRGQLEKMLIFYLKDYLRYLPTSQSISPEEDVTLASCGSDSVSIRKCLVAGYFSNAAKLGADGNYHTIRGQVTVTPYSSSIIAKYGALPEWIIYHEAIYLKDTTSIREVTRIDPMWLLEMAPHYYKVNKTS